MELPPQVNLFLADWGKWVVLALLIIGVVLIGGAGYVYSNPPVRTVTETVSQQTFSTEVGHSAVVTGNTTLYPPGERLTAMPVYLMRATPELTLSIRTSVPEGAPVEVIHELTLVQRAVREGESFFDEQQRLITTEHTVRNGSVTDATRINLSKIAQRNDDLRDEISGAGTLTTRIELTVSYSTDQYTGDLGGVSTLQISEGSYLLSTDIDDSTTRSETITRRQTAPPDTTTVGLLGGMGFLTLVGAMLVERYRRRISIEEIRATLDHAQFDDWISHGEFPTADDNQYTAISSLEDLVDIAIDSDKRVIYDASFQAYAVVDGKVVYYFSPGNTNIDQWLDA